MIIVRKGMHSFTINNNDPECIEINYRDRDEIERLTRTVIEKLSTARIKEYLGFINAD